MILTEIDHIAIAVKDLEAAIDYYKRAFGAEVDHREIVESSRKLHTTVDANSARQSSRQSN